MWQPACFATVITQPFIYLMVSLTDAPKCSHTQLIKRVATQKLAQTADFDAGSLMFGFSSHLSCWIGSISLTYAHEIGHISAFLVFLNILEMLLFL